MSPADALQLGQDLISREGTNAIVTPVYLEFLCGARLAEETALFVEFLEAFQLVDNGEVRREDWDEAKRLIQRVPAAGKPRQLADCLIKAIAKRLRYDVQSSDGGFPR
jgi:predicted nucleic acid-binding protein